MGIVMWLIGLVIFYFIIYSAVQGAINKSELNETLKEVRRLLEQKNMNESNDHED